MWLPGFAALAAGTLMCASAARAIDNDATVPTYHADAARSGHYVVPGLTWRTLEICGKMRRSTGACRGTSTRSRSTGARLGRRAD
jgi:hypothetical protein